MKNKIIVVGAGAAGLLAAGTAAQRGLHVTLLERNARPARKVMITGKGRCNLTNASALDELIQNVPGNGRFLYSAFSRFMPEDTMRLIEAQGVALKVERGRRVFPCSDKAVDVVDALVGFVRSHGAHILQGRVQSLMMENGVVTGVITQDGRQFPADAVIVATGGKSYPTTGSTGDGYLLAQQAGHTIVAPRPSLVPLVIHEGWCAQLQGLSLKNVSISVYDHTKKKEIFQEMGEMLFTHFGVTGPLVLSASAHMRAMEPRRYQIFLDMKPALGLEQLDLRLQRDFTENPNKDFGNVLANLLPKKMIPVMIRLSNIPAHEKVNQVNKEMRRNFARLLKKITMTVEGFRPLEEAIVTAGGVNVREVNPKTMASKLAEGLFFAGEVLDVDAYTGGYNLQIAFSTGYLAGRSALAGTDEDDGGKV